MKQQLTSSQLQAVDKLQSAARNALTPTEILLSPFDSNEVVSPFTLIVYTQMAFDIPTQLLRYVQSWSRFMDNSNSGINDLEINSLLSGYFEDWRSRNT